MAWSCEGLGREVQTGARWREIWGAQLKLFQEEEMVGEHGAACWRARRCAAVGPDVAEGRRLQCLWDQMGAQHAAATSSPAPEEEMDPGSDGDKVGAGSPKEEF